MNEILNLYGGAMMPSMTQPMPPGQGPQMPPGQGQQMPPGQGQQMPPGQGQQMPPGQGPQMPPGQGQQTNVGVGAKANNSNKKGNNANKKGNNANKKDGNTSNNNKNKNKNNNKNNNKNKNEISNNNKNALNNLNNEIRERIASIKLNDDYRVIAFWICWGLSVIILLSTFITTPIRYSEKEPVYKLSYNRLYYYVTIILISTISIYVYKGRERLPLIYGEDLYIKVIPVVVLFLSLIVINIFDSPGEKEDGSFNTPPSTLVKDKRVMITQYVLLILLLFGMIVCDLMKSGNGFSDIESHHIKKTIPVLIVIILVGYLLYNSVKYNVKRYDLPETWRK